MKHQALFDTQQSKMRTPGWEFDRIVAASGAEFDYDSLSYVVDCKKIPTLPKIRVSLGSTNMNYFEVSPEQYIVKVSDALDCRLFPKKYYSHIGSSTGASRKRT